MDPITLALALLFTAMTAVIVPIYYREHGPANFLWFSDIALFGMTIALWLESPLIASMMAVGVLLPEAACGVSTCGGPFFGRSASSLAGALLHPLLPPYLL